MSSAEAITLGPREHDKLGIYHVDVVREGRVTVVGQPRDIEDGEEIIFDHVGIKASRKGEEYTFSKVA